jgi:ATP-dependent helicase/nuclease subunit B
MLTLEEIEEEMMKQFKMNGLMLADENVIRLMDRTVESGNSHIVAAGFKKDGTLSKASKVANREDFDSLRRFVRNKYVETGNDIISGVVDIDPFKLKDRLPCTFCSFKSVCQFDRSIDSNDFRKLVPKSKEDILEAIKKEGVDLG